MSHYRRAKIHGASYFFTLVTFRHQSIICDAPFHQALRAAIVSVREKRPFTINAWVLLPDHLHCIWTLPPGDADYPIRWSMIKRQVSILCRELYHHPDWLNDSKRKHRESTLWQRRYWEHQIRDEGDFMRHVDYIHYNPVKHHCCERVADWPYSTFHRYVEKGIYSSEWGNAGVDWGALEPGE